MPQAQSDHDILIRLDENVRILHEKVGKLTDDHEDRIRKLERETNRWIGRQSTIGGAIGVGAAFIAAFISGGKW